MTEISTVIVQIKDYLSYSAMQSHWAGGCKQMMVSVSRMAGFHLTLIKTASVTSTVT